jgi:peptidyl-prolyl cis-trans isomerase SurA
MRKLPILVAFLASAGLLAAAAPLALAQKAPPPSARAKDSKPAGPKPIVVERVVAVVNDTVILESELYQRAAPELGELERDKDPREKQKQFKAILRRTLDDMVNDELMIQAAAEAELNVSDEEVDKAMADVKKTNKMTDAQFSEALSAQGYTMAGYKKDVKKQILRMRAINIMVRPRVSVTDADVKERYARMSSKSGAITELHVAHILVALPEGATAEEQEAARRRAGELVERARGGEEFAKLALGSSEDESSKDKGGDIGWFKRGELPTEWEEQLFASDKGDVRGPIAGPRGLHVFYVMDVKKDALKNFDEVKDQLKNELYSDEMEKQGKIWIEELRRKAHVEVKL